MIESFRIGDLLTRIKNQITISDSAYYKRVTISGNHKGVSLRDEVIGSSIGTKKQFIIRGGDFILSKIDARNGAFGIIPEELNNALITGNFWTYALNTSLVDIEWFLNFTRSHNFIQICIASSTGSTHRKYLDERVFLNHELTLPKIEDQRKMVKKYESSYIKLKNIKNEIKTQNQIAIKLKQSILQEAIQGKLTKDWRDKNPNVEPARELLERIKAEKEQLVADKKIKKEKSLSVIAEEKIPFDIPDSWVWCRFSETSKISRGGSPRPIGSYITSKKNGINWIKIGDTKSDNKYIKKTSQKIKPEGMKKSRFVEPGDFLLTNSMSFGKPFIMKTSGCIHDGWLLIRYDKKILKQDYLYYMLSSRYIYSSFKASTKGAVVKNLNIDSVKSTIIPIPPIEEQKMISEKIKTLMQKCDQLEKEIKKSEANAEMLMQSVLKEAFDNQ